MIKTEGKPVKQVTTEIAQKLIAQGGRCINSGGFCVYDDGKGSHCAIGWLLPRGGGFDDMQSVTGFIRDGIHLGLNHNFIEENSSILYRVQRLHDIGLRSEREIELSSICRDYPNDIDAEAWQPWVEMGA